MVWIILLVSNSIFSAGVLDTTFGNGGQVIFRCGGTTDFATGAPLQLLIQPDGKILLIGSAQIQPQGPHSFAVVRYLDITP